MTHFISRVRRQLAMLLCLVLLVALCPAQASAEEEFYQRPLAGGVVQVAMSRDHIVVLRCDGTVAAVGNDDRGQCQVSGWSRIVRIWAADGITLGLTESGEVVNTAQNLANWKNITDVSVGYCSVADMTVVAGWRADGTAVTMGVNDRGGFKFNQGTCNVDSWRDIVQIVVHEGVYGLKRDGSVVRAGFPGEEAPEVDVSGWSGVSQLMVGNSCVFGLTNQGDVLSGSSCFDTENWSGVVRLVPGYLNGIYGITASGKVYGAGEVSDSHESLSGVVDLAAGPVTVMGIQADGSVVFSPEPDLSWAERNRWRDVEQLVYEPGFANVAVLRKDGTVVAAGIDGMESPAPCDGWTNIAKLYRSGELYLGLKEDGSLISNADLDVSVLTEGVENTMPQARQGLISAGARYSVYVRDDGRVSGAGLNEYGCLNIQNWTDIALVSAYYHTVGLKTNGTVVATGPNGSGQCDVSSWKDIVDVCAGGVNTIGLTEQGTVLVVGSNDYGQLSMNGRKGIVDVCAGASTVYALTNKGLVYMAGSDSYGQDAVQNWEGISAIAAGTSHVVGLRPDGTVVAAGDNRDGQCNVQTWTDIVAICAGGNRTIGLKSDGTLVCTGSNDFGQGNVESWTNVIAVSTGIYHTLALTAGGNILSTGSNEYGQCDIVY